MATYEMIVTDVTCYGDLYCVAGWDRQVGCMIRPEPPQAIADNEASRFWSEQFAGQGKFFSVGSVVKFNADLPPEDFPFPHATEDRIFDTTVEYSKLGEFELTKVSQEVSAGVSPSLKAAFDGALVIASSKKAYVPSGHNGPSLGAIELDPTQIDFFEDTYNPSKPRLRARIVDGTNEYDLSVTADAARSQWKAQGLIALCGDAKASGRIHVRVGLSRPFAAMPDQCYVQINGLYFL